MLIVHPFPSVSEKISYDVYFMLVFCAFLRFYIPFFSGMKPLPSFSHSGGWISWPLNASRSNDSWITHEVFHGDAMPSRNFRNRLAKFLDLDVILTNCFFKSGHAYNCIWKSVFKLLTPFVLWDSSRSFQEGRDCKPCLLGD